VQQATKALLFFPTTYCCEAVYKTLTIFKTKHRSQLQPGDDIKCTLTTTDPI